MKKIAIIIVLVAFLIAGCGSKTVTTTQPIVDTINPEQPTAAPAQTPQAAAPAPTSQPSTSTAAPQPSTTPSQPDVDVHAPDIEENITIATGKFKFVKYEAKRVDEGAYIHGEIENIGNVPATNIPVYARVYFNHQDISGGLIIIDKVGVGQVKEFGFTIPTDRDFNSYLISFEKIGELKEVEISGTE